ncbi:hypothetical protein [Desulfurobacterium indicum]|nr:hypothetical protein [Desulfurobacterium indicum]
MKKIIATYLLLLTLTGSASSTESLKRLFENQNYDEIIGILQTIR